MLHLITWDGIVQIFENQEHLLKFYNKNGNFYKIVHHGEVKFLYHKSHNYFCGLLQTITS